jgi:hypothetical protein
VKATDSQKQKKTRKYSVLGLIIGGLLLLSTLGNTLYVIRNPKLPFLGPLITLVPAVAMIVRSFRQPINFGRGLAVVCGGFSVGTAIVKLVFATQREPAVSVFLLALGIFLLWVGFKKPKTNNVRGQETPGENIQIGMSANDRNRQAALIDELIQQIRDTESMEPAAKQSSEKYLEKTKEEILDEQQPDGNRIAKWLGKVQPLFTNIDKASEVYEKAKEVFRSLNVPF